MSCEAFWYLHDIIAGDPFSYWQVNWPHHPVRIHLVISWLNMGRIWCQDCWGVPITKVQSISTAIVCAMPFEMSVVNICVMAWWQDMSLPKGWDGKVGLPWVHLAL